jgi:hypothetical protein
VAAGALTVDLAPCAPASSPSSLQSWTYNATSGQLRSVGLPGMCLTSNQVPAVPYAQLCARVTAYSGFNGPVPVPGYCLHVDGTGAWQLRAGAATPLLANGTLPGSPFDPAAPHVLSLTTLGDAVTAAVNGTVIARATSSAYAGGMVAFGSGYHPAQFDDFSVAAA